MFQVTYCDLKLCVKNAGFVSKVQCSACRKDNILNVRSMFADPLYRLCPVLN